MPLGKLSWPVDMSAPPLDDDYTVKDPHLRMMGLIASMRASGAIGGFSGIAGFCRMSSANGSGIKCRPCGHSVAETPAKLVFASFLGSGSVGMSAAITGAAFRRAMNQVIAMSLDFTSLW